jgi:hypothetical protein
VLCAAPLRSAPTRLTMSRLTPASSSPAIDRPRSPRPVTSMPMSSRASQPWPLRLLAVIAVLTAMLGSGLTASSSGDLQGQITSTRSAADALRAQIASDSRQIAGTGNGIAQAQARLARIQSTLNQRVAQLRGVQTSLLNARPT